MSNQAPVLNVGIIGLGMAGAGVAPLVTAMPNTNLIGAADVNSRALDDFSERYHGRTYASAEELCADSEIDAVWIATPNPYHCPHTVLAARHGKHVIIEKPMATSLQEAVVRP